MRPPMVTLSAAYGAGVWAGLTVSLPQPLAALLAACAALASLRFGWQAVLAGAAALGIAVGGGRAARDRRTCAVVWQPGPRAVTLLVHDAPGPRGVATATVMATPEGCHGELRLRLPPSAIGGGTTLVAVGAYRGKGVFRADHVRGLQRAPPWRFALRHRVARRIRGLYGGRAGMVEALVLGRREDIDPGLRAEFAASGLAHLLAISGLHVGIVAAWLELLARALRARRGAWLWSAAATWGYVAVLGFPAPATRAAAFISIYGVARVRGRHPLFGAVLAAAAFAVLLADPGAVTSVGAWLSVAAVWGTHAASRVLPPHRRHPALRLFASSVGATLATAPITAYVFGSVAPVGVLANLVAIPLAGVAVPGVFASLLLGATVAGGAGLALAGIERTAALAAMVPGGQLTGEPGVRFALPWIVALAAAAWWLRVRPAWRVMRLRLLAVGAVGAWTLAVLSLRPVERARGLTLHVLDVGQGDAIALRTPRGRWILVDAGPRTPEGDAGHRVVLPFLRRRGVRSLAALVVSHGDADHLGGAPAVATALDPGLVLEPGQALGTALYLEHLAVVDREGLAWRAARRGDTLVVDSVTLAVLHPTTAWMAREVVPNENSVVLRVTYGCFSAVLAGDLGAPAESLLLATGGLEPAALLKVGHHGSRGSTTEAWLEALRPAFAVISVGRKNRYGHPAPEVLERLARRQVRVFRTDRGGTVTIRSDGRYLEIQQGVPPPLPELLWCRLGRWLPSSASSWSRSGCTRPPPVNSPICSTTSPSPPR